MAEHMTAEQLRAELERIALLVQGEVCIARDENGESPATMHDYELDQAASALHAIAAHLSGMAAVPKGWKLVPVEPNWDMRNEGREFLIDGIEKDPERLAYFLWKTMIAAAPEPPHG